MKGSVRGWLEPPHQRFGWCCTQHFFSQGRAEGTGSSLKPQQKQFPKSAAAQGAGPCCTQVSVTNRTAAPSVPNKWSWRQNKLLVCLGCSHSCALFIQSSNLCYKLWGQHSWWGKGTNTHNQAGSKKCCCAIKQNISESSSSVTVSILKCTNLQMCLKKQTQTFTGLCRPEFALSKDNLLCQDVEEGSIKKALEG